jgi:hypothetical protein
MSKGLSIGKPSKNDIFVTHQMYPWQVVSEHCRTVALQQSLFPFPFDSANIQKIILSIT